MAQFAQGCRMHTGEIEVRKGYVAKHRSNELFLLFLAMLCTIPLVRKLLARFVHSSAARTPQPWSSTLLPNLG